MGGVSRTVEDTGELVAVVDLPQDFPQNSSCKIVVGATHSVMYNVYYEVND